MIWGVDKIWDVKDLGHLWLGYIRKHQKAGTHNVRMWALVPHAKDMPLLWSLWYRKCPTSFIPFSKVWKLKWQWNVFWILSTSWVLDTFIAQYKYMTLAQHASSQSKCTCARAQNNGPQLSDQHHNSNSHSDVDQWQIKFRILRICPDKPTIQEPRTPSQDLTPGCKQPSSDNNRANQTLSQTLIAQ